MKKPLKGLMVIGLLLALCVSVVSFVSADESFSEGINNKGVEKMLDVARLIKDYNDANGKREQLVIGESNDEEIYNHEFELTYNKAVAFGSDDPYEDAVKSVKEHALDSKFAQENNISVTEKEVLDYVSYQRELYEQESDLEVKAVIKSYIEALGITEDEYWNDYEIKESYNYILHNKVIKFQEENNINREELLENISFEITNREYQEDSIDKTISNFKQETESNDADNNFNSDSE